MALEVVIFLKNKMKKTLQEHIDEVMDWFDFDKVHKHMENVGWKWAILNAIPEKADLRMSVRKEMVKLYNKVKKSVNGSVSYESGGFEIEYTWGIDENGEWDNFNIRFILTSWYTGQ
jgi:hypothetical protein